jgi:bifunctional NMN adenylyltransferase/nudix hydrolase
MIKYPTSFQTTDILVINRLKNEVLLGRKPAEDKFRLIGGFVDPVDLSLEDAASRELREEAGINLEVGTPKYQFSYRVDDKRYRDSQDKILTAVFTCDYLFGFATASDDICEVKWISELELTQKYPSLIVETHQPLIRKLIENGVI